MKDIQELCDRAYEHGEDDAIEGVKYNPDLYSTYPEVVQRAYLRGYRDNSVSWTPSCP